VLLVIIGVIKNIMHWVKEHKAGLIQLGHVVGAVLVTAFKILGGVIKVVAGIIAAFVAGHRGRCPDHVVRDQQRVRVDQGGYSCGPRRHQGCRLRHRHRVARDFGRAEDRVVRDQQRVWVDQGRYPHCKAGHHADHQRHLRCLAGHR
jgi:hypothetical protein